MRVTTIQSYLQALAGDKARGQDLCSLQPLGARFLVKPADSTSAEPQAQRGTKHLQLQH